MAEQTLEERVAALERAPVALQQQVGAPATKKNWWEDIGRTMDAEEEAAFHDALAYGRYFRKTGREATPGRKPGAPIPEPNYDEDDTDCAVVVDEPKLPDR